MVARVLIIDDEDLFREDLAVLLRRHGHECETASNGEEGVALAQEFDPDVVLCDLVMPGKAGMETLSEILQISPESSVVLITAYGTLESAVDAFRMGAADYITKPLLIKDVLQKIDRLTKYKRLSQEVKFLRRKVSQNVESLTMIGHSRPMKDVLELITKVAPTRSTVLVIGESGTGKELVARGIHDLSNPKDLSFVAISCAGVPEHLLESELFGHVEGAFTGAIADKIGFFELASEGTLLLDEIGEMPLALQTKLLRVLEQREFYRVGQTKPIPLRARVVAATNKNLRQLVEEGKFREDLFFRIAVFEIRLPALRERRDDIPLLVEHFINKFNTELKRKCVGVDNEAIRRLLSYSWPGNVRELRNVIERAMILNHQDHITWADLPPEIAGVSESTQSSDDLRSAMRAYEKEHIRRVLGASEGNKEETARRLGVNPSTLYRKMIDLGICAETASEPSG